jgi:hypothetical protein
MTEAKGMAPKEWEGRNRLASVRHRRAPSLSVHCVGGEVPGSSSGCAIRAGSLATTNSDANPLMLSGLVTASPNDGPLDHPGRAASSKAGDPVVPTNVRRPGQALSDGQTPPERRIGRHSSANRCSIGPLGRSWRTLFEPTRDDGHPSFNKRQEEVIE